MAKPVTAVCPACHNEIEVDPLGDIWPQHHTPMFPNACTHSGQPMPFQTDDTLRVVGTPVIVLGEKQMPPHRGEELLIGLRYVDDEVRIDFPTTGKGVEEGVACMVRREDAPAGGAVVKARLGDGLLAPKVTITVEYPSIPKFSTPEEADAWMEKMA